MDIDYNKDPVEAAQQRAAFFDTPGLDRLYAMFVALLEQLAIANERHDTLVRVMIDKGMIDETDLTDYEPSDEAVQARIRQHDALTKAVLKTIEDELSELAGE